MICLDCLKHVLDFSLFHTVCLGPQGESEDLVWSAVLWKALHFLNYKGD